MKFKFIPICLLITILFSGCGSMVENMRQKVEEVSSTEIDNPVFLSTKQEKIEEERDYTAYKNKYTFSKLSDAEKEVYDDIYKTIYAHEKAVTLYTEDLDLIHKAYNAVLADNGGFFWVEGYEYVKYMKDNEFSRIEFRPAYSKTQDERDIYQAELDVFSKKILEDVENTSDEYYVVKHINDYLTANVYYVPDASENQNIISALIYKETVCMGYATAMQYLLEQCGIQSCIVTGVAEGVSHAWNLACINGEYYYFDATMGACSFHRTSIYDNFTDYEFFGMTTIDVLKTHTIANEELYPVCNARKNNYYVKEGLYFTEYNEDIIGTKLKEAYEAETVISMKFETYDVYAACLEHMFHKQHISSYCEGIETISYIENQVDCVITVAF